MRPFADSKNWAPTSKIYGNFCSVMLGLTKKVSCGFQRFLQRGY